MIDFNQQEELSPKEVSDRIRADRKAPTKKESEAIAMKARMETRRAIEDIKSKIKGDEL